MNNTNNCIMLKPEETFSIPYFVGYNASEDGIDMVNVIGYDGDDGIILFHGDDFNGDETWKVTRKELEKNREWVYKTLADNAELRAKYGLC